MNDCIMRGDIFCANLNNGIGAEQRGYRPVLIIQNNTGNKFNGFVCVGNANDLDAPGAIFSYQSYVREQEAMLPFLIDIFETNTGVK